MIKLIPNAPSDCEVIGYIYSDHDSSILGEDMVEVVLPNGILVSAGWYPEGDPNGEYRINATKGLKYVVRSTAKDANEANEIVEDFVRQLHDGGMVIVSDSTFQDTTVATMDCT